MWCECKCVGPTLEYDIDNVLNFICCKLLDEQKIIIILYHKIFYILALLALQQALPLMTCDIQLPQHVNITDQYYNREKIFKQIEHLVKKPFCYFFMKNLKLKF